MSVVIFSQRICTPSKEIFYTLHSWQTAMIRDVSPQAVFVRHVCKDQRNAIRVIIHCSTFHIVVYAGCIYKPFYCMSLTSQNSNHKRQETLLCIPWVNVRHVSNDKTQMLNMFNAEQSKKSIFCLQFQLQCCVSLECCVEKRRTFYARTVKVSSKCQVTDS